MQSLLNYITLHCTPTTFILQERNFLTSTIFLSVIVIVWAEKAMTQFKYNTSQRVLVQYSIYLFLKD